MRVIKQATPSDAMKTLLQTLILLLTLASKAAVADVVLMVHGYMSDASTWERSSISQILDANNLRHSGRFVASPYGPVLLLRNEPTAGDKVYLGDLPSLQPVVVQSDILHNMLLQLQSRHPEEAITVIGHSAGGVVARLTLVRHQHPRVTRLVTIASPHLGTSRTEEALDITDNHGPFNMVKSFFGGSDYDALRHSRALLHDLSHPRPGSVLHWLNIQAHPAIEYVSIVRLNPHGYPGDNIVPGFSQDMNNVPALVGRSSVLAVPSPHTLTPADAGLLLNLLKKQQAS
jgi:pimeloyl-ACP methyl ester carboxylesterase